VRDGKIKPRDKEFIVVRLQGHLSCPTPLPESPTREFSSLDQKPPLWRRKPYTPNYTPQLCHNTITTSTRLLHTNLLHTNSSSHLSYSLLTSSQLSSLDQKPPLWRRKPYTPNYTPQLCHNTITTSTRLLHTNLLHTNSSSTILGFKKVWWHSLLAH
jgi:hypothetical protein